MTSRIARVSACVAVTALASSLLVVHAQKGPALPDALKAAGDYLEGRAKYLKFRQGKLGGARAAASFLHVVLLAGAQATVAATGRYIVTTKPLNVGVGYGQCIAVDPANPKGVWWWEAGSTGCSSRSTGPVVFPAIAAHVSVNAGRINASFQLQTHSSTRPVVDVRVIIENGVMRHADSTRSVPTQLRNDLDIPERCCY